MAVDGWMNGPLMEESQSSNAWSSYHPHPRLQIKVMVAGGSSMPLVLEDFFDMIRTPVIVGYGMTVREPTHAARSTDHLL